MQALSPVGRCKSFDASGDGYGRGEGFTIALLTRVMFLSNITFLLRSARLLYHVIQKMHAAPGMIRRLLEGANIAPCIPCSARTVSTGEPPQCSMTILAAPAPSSLDLQSTRTAAPAVSRRPMAPPSRPSSGGTCDLRGLTCKCKQVL